MEVCGGGVILYTKMYIVLGGVATPQVLELWKVRIRIGKTYIKIHISMGGRKMKRKMQLVRLEEDMAQKIQAMKVESGFDFSKWVRAKFFEQFGSFKPLIETMDKTEYEFLKSVPGKLASGCRVSALQAYYNNTFKRDLRLNYFYQLVERVSMEANKNG
jgi:hypothetical protein